MEKEFLLEPVLNKQVGEYFIDHFEENKALVVEYVESKNIDAITIVDDAGYKAIKKLRAELNNKSKSINAVRIQVKKLITATIESQLKDIDAVISDASALVDAKIKEWEANMPKEEKATSPKVYTMLVSSLSEEDLKAVAEYANKKHCTTGDIK